MSKTINEQTIINRHSVRTYQTTPITTYHQQELLNFIDHLENPWNIKIKITFINDLKDTDKIGTYGMIKDPAFFITALISTSIQEGTPDILVTFLLYVFSSTV